jgi:antitoxin component HigA of HigAB toxin-antitoxin module
MKTIKTRQEYLVQVDRYVELINISFSDNELSDSESEEYTTLEELLEEYKSKYPEESLYHPISCIRIEMRDRGLTIDEIRKHPTLEDNFIEIMEGNEYLNLHQIRLIHEVLGIGYDTLCEPYSMPDPLYPH